MKRILFCVMLLGTGLVTELSFAHKSDMHQCSCNKKHFDDMEVRESRLKELLSSDWAMLEQDLQQAMNDFQGTTYNGVVGKLLGLLDAEMMLVDNLLDGVSGYAMECSMHHRNRQMRKATPAAVNVYEKIMNIATFDKHLYPEYKTQWSRKPDMNVQLKLASHQKKEFLCNMHEVLSDYYKKFGQLLYGRSGRGTNIRNEVNTDVDSVEYCPVVH